MSIRNFFSLARPLRRKAPAAPAAPLFPPGPPARPRPQPAAPKSAGVAFFHVRTGRGNWLAAGDTRAGMTEAPDETRLVAVLPEANRQMLFLLAPDLRCFEIQSDGMRGPAISALALQTDQPGIIRLRHPLSARFLAVTRPGEGAEAGCVVFDSFGRTLLDAFQLVPAATIPADMHVAALELAEAATRPFRAAALLALIRAGVVRPALVEAVLRLLPQDELSALAGMLLHSAEDSALLKAAMPDDVWMVRVLPALAQWDRDRPGAPGQYLVSPAADEVAGDPMAGFGQLQAGLCLTGLARAQVAGRRMACILATARNEGPYLLEWLAYHRSVGFEHFFLYTNDNDDGSDDLLSALARVGVITWIRNEPGTHYGPQYKAYAHALIMLPHILEYRWTAILDLDEYFCFDTKMFSSVADFVGFHETQPVDALALCWLIFAADAQQAWAPGPTLQRFTRREAGANPHVKSIFRTSKFWHAQAHFPHATLGAPTVFRTESGGLHHHPGVTDRIPAFAEKPSANQAWINHYLLRTAPEALWKLSRGLGDWPARTPERQAEFTRFVCRSFLALAEGALVEDTRIQACARGQAAHLAWLMDLPGVAAAQARIQAEFPARLAALTRRFLSEKGADEVPALEKFRAVLRGLG